MINQASELKWFCEKQEDYLLLLFSLPNSFPIRMKQKKKILLKPFNTQDNYKLFLGTS